MNAIDLPVSVTLASMANVRPNLENSHEFFITGNIDFDNIHSLFKQACLVLDQQEKGKEIIFNFSQVVQHNSAALALLTAILRYAKQHMKNLLFLDLPAQLWATAKISDIDKLLTCA